MNGLESPEWGWNVKAETRDFLLLFAESRKLERVTVPHPDGPQGAGGFGESLSTVPFLTCHRIVWLSWIWRCPEITEKMCDLKN